MMWVKLTFPSASFLLLLLAVMFVVAVVVVVVDDVDVIVDVVAETKPWFEVHQTNDKRSDTMANVAEQEWFSGHPWPTQMTHNRGNEFLGKEFQEMAKTGTQLSR